ncbi:MAG: hypothetical protein Kow0092_36420 [Deferrisomatales bacterium]
MSLRTRFVGVVLLTLLPVGALLGWKVRQQQESAVRASVARAGVRAHRLAAEGRHVVAEARAFVGLLAGLENPCAARLPDLVAADLVYAAVAVVGPEGEVLCSAPAAEPHLEVGEALWFTAARRAGGTPVAGPALRCRISNRVGVPMACARLGPGGAFLGAVVATVDFGELVGLKETGGEPGEVVLVFDGDGRVVARRPGHERFAGREAAFLAELRALGAAPGRLTGLDGVERVYASAQVFPGEDATPTLWAAAGVPWAPVAGALWGRFVRDAALAALALAIAAAGAWLVGEKAVLRPVRRLTAVAQRLEGGDLSARSGMGGSKGELAYLGEVFDRMAESVESSTHRLRSLASEYRALVESGPAMVFLLRRSLAGPGLWTVHYVSPQVRDLAGVAAWELRSDPGRWQGCLGEADRRRALRVLDRLLRRPRPAGYDHRLLRPDGRPVWVHTRLIPLRDEGGQPSVLGVVVDVDRRRRAEQGLARYATQLEERNRELQRFAYVASHDLQEPLRVVASYAALLRRRYRDRLDRDAEEFIDFMVDAVGRMQRMIQGLLVYARVSSRGRAPEPVDAATCFAEALANLSVAVEEAGAQVDCGPLPAVRADPGQLTQLFQNLLANAVKFRGETPPRIRVDAGREGSRWVFRVRDDGVGIPPESSERVFGLFERLGQEGVRPGSGMGLAICKRIVERHGGRIWVESPPGGGTCVAFALPAREEEESTP